MRRRINVGPCSLELKSLEFKNGFLFHFTPDINECASEQHNCHQDANCTNLKGSFNCTCKHGYQGNGTDCEGGSCYIMMFDSILCSLLYFVFLLFYIVL